MDTDQTVKSPVSLHVVFIEPVYLNQHCAVFLKHRVAEQSVVLLSNFIQLIYLKGDRTATGSRGRG